MVFIDFVARWYGSAHDARIFDFSAIRDQLESRKYEGILLGDQAYPCRRYILTPYRNPSNPAEEKYNDGHRKTRLIEERCFGVLKRVFACLKLGLRVKLDTSLPLIIACVVMYNFLRMRNAIQPTAILDDDDIPEQRISDEVSIMGAALRRQITDDLFVSIVESSLNMTSAMARHKQITIP